MASCPHTGVAPTTHANTHPNTAPRIAPSSPRNLHPSPHRKGLALLTLFLLAACCTPEPQPVVARAASWTPAPPWSGPTDLHLWLYNVKLLPLLDNDDALLRARRIPAFVPDSLDALVLCEAYPSPATDLLLRHLHTLGFTHVSDPLDQGNGLFHGGVRVLSRHPIRDQHHLVYPCGAFPDSLADKGAVHVALDHPRGTVHLIATHLQSPFAWRADTARQVQRAQLAALADFLCQLDLPPDEPRVLLGDLNYDLHDPPSLGLLAQELGDPPPIGPDEPFTYDGTRNGMARAGARRWVDHVLLPLPHAWVERGGAWVVPLRDHDGRDLSDHFPVVARFRWSH